VWGRNAEGTGLSLGEGWLSIRMAARNLHRMRGLFGGWALKVGSWVSARGKLVTSGSGFQGAASKRHEPRTDFMAKAVNVGAHRREVAALMVEVWGIVHDRRHVHGEDGG